MHASVDAGPGLVRPDNPGRAEFFQDFSALGFERGSPPVQGVSNGTRRYLQPKQPGRKPPRSLETNVLAMVQIGEQGVDVGSERRSRVIPAGGAARMRLLQAQRQP